MRKKALLLLTLTTLVVLVRGSAAWACACDPAVAKHEPATVRSEVKRSYAVFTGMVATVVQDADDVKVTFAVHEVYKANVSTPYVVTTPRSADACGIDFVAGKSYDVFVSLKKNIPTTQVCAGTDATGILRKAGLTPRLTLPDDRAVDLPPASDDPKGARAGAIGAASLLLVLIAAYYLWRVRQQRAAGRSKTSR
jgi:hypothetical protein